MDISLALAPTLAEHDGEAPAASRSDPRLRESLHVEFLMASDVGGLFLVGWVDDRLSSVETINLEIPGWKADVRPENIARLRRRDVEAAVGGASGHQYGFWAAVFSDAALEEDASCDVSVRLQNGSRFHAMVPLRCCTETQLRTTICDYLSAGQAGYGSAPASGDVLARVLTEQRNRLIPLATARHAKLPDVPPYTVELVAVSDNGGVMIVGWIDDRSADLDCISLTGADWKICFDTASIGRSCRTDVQRALDTNASHHFGFWAFAATQRKLNSGVNVGIEVSTRFGVSPRTYAVVNRMSDIELRNTILSHFASATFAGNATAEAMLCLDHLIGQEIVNFNLDISRAAVAAPYVERFRPFGSSSVPKASILVCLYGKPEFLFLQAAIFAGRPGIEDYEFVYVCNSPELSERLVNEARIAVDIYGIQITLVLLAGNAGFGAANNAGVAHCRSDRILIMNPDVFPHDGDWARRHLDIVSNLPDEQTRLFGVPLYYDDGSLMHGGMFFEIDTALSTQAGGFSPRDMLRVEHYGKGAPFRTTSFLKSRPVPAVTGAFISCDRSWFEGLGGFTEDFVFGHYEDADLCLKSLARGVPSWLHDIKLWHLEGKGSTRLAVHEGSAIVNRWLFSRRWGALVAEELNGPAPRHKLLAAVTSPARSDVSVPLGLAGDRSPQIHVVNPSFVERDTAVQARGAAAAVAAKPRLGRQKTMR